MCAKFPRATSLTHRHRLRRRRTPPGAERGQQMGSGGFAKEKSEARRNTRRKEEEPFYFSMNLDLLLRETRYDYYSYAHNKRKFRPETILHFPPSPLSFLLVD